MDQKKSFIMYHSWARTIVGLSDDLAGKLIKRICNYELGQDIEDENQTINAIFDGYKSIMDDKMKMVRSWYGDSSVLSITCFFAWDYLRIPPPA